MSDPIAQPIPHGLSSEEAVSLSVPPGSGELVTPLFSIAKSTRAFLTLLLAEIDLYPGQDQLLFQLRENGAVSVSFLAAQLSVRPSTASKMLDRLIDRGLAKRMTSSLDARRKTVSLTPEGEAMTLRIAQIWQRLETELGRNLGEAEYHQLSSALRQADHLLVSRLRRLR